MNGSSLLKEIGRSYLVSSLIPASLFVFLSGLLFGDFIPEPLAERLEVKIAFFDASVALLVIVTFWLGFALYSSQDRVIKLFEGYSFPLVISNILTRFQLRWHRKHTKYIKKTYSASEKPLLQFKYLHLKEMHPEALAELQDLELQAPLDEENILPTKLGNVLRASELYPYERYGIDGITIWPRLVNFLPRDFQNDLEEINNQLAFMLNSSLLIFLLAIVSSIVVGVECLCTHQFGLFMNICESQAWLNGFSNYSIQFYAIVGLISWFLGYTLYRVGVGVGEGYGLYVRTAFDLYRNNLLEHLNLTLTENLENDKDTWEKISDFFVAGQTLGPIRFGKPVKKVKPKIFSPSFVLVGGLIVGGLYKIIRSQKNRRAVI